MKDFVDTLAHRHSSIHSSTTRTGLVRFSTNDSQSPIRFELEYNPQILNQSNPVKKIFSSSLHFHRRHATQVQSIGNSEALNHQCGVYHTIVVY